jgi:spermidine/putrescine transport system ATP-binding protein
LASSGVSLQVRDLRKTYGQGAGAVHALDTVSLDIRQNEFFTLLGPSGCGKTTLLRLIAGFDHPTGGRILLEGEDIGTLPPYRRPVNTVFQNYALFPHMTVAGNIAFGLEMLRRPRAETERTVDEMLRLIRMGELRDRRTSEISGGQQQRVALARALAPRPKVLLLDEPLSALDLKLRKEMQIELKRLQHETGITFVFVTHDQEEALTMSDRIAVMSRGKVLQVGTPREIYDRPADRFVADFIGESNFLTGRLERRDGSRGTVRLDMGATIVAALPDGPLSSDDVTVVVRPEHVNLGAAGADATLAGTIETVVYFGTDTHYHLRLDGGLPFIVRAQNRRGQPVDALRESMPVGVRIEDGVAQVLRHS